MGEDKKMVPLFEGRRENAIELFQLWHDIRKGSTDRSSFLDKDFQDKVTRFFYLIENHGNSISIEFIQKSNGIANRVLANFIERNQVYQFSYDTDRGVFDLRELVKQTSAQVFMLHSLENESSRLKSDKLVAITAFYMCIHIVHDLFGISDKVPSQRMKTVLSAYFAHCIGCPKMERIRDDSSPIQLTNNYSRDTEWLKSKDHKWICDEVNNKGSIAFIR